MTAEAARRADLARIEAALLRAGRLLAGYARRDLEVEEKRPGDPVTEADRAVDALRRRGSGPGAGGRGRGLPSGGPGPAVQLSAPSSSGLVAANPRIAEAILGLPARR